MPQPKVLTADEVVRAGAKRAEWCSALATALRNWCDDNGYHPRNKLGSELGIPTNPWQHLFDATGVVCGDITVYARLYVKTGLAELNPRKVPSRIRFVPRTRRSYEYVRAWTDQEYEDWKKDYRGSSSLVESPKEISAPVAISVQEQVEPQTLGSLIDRLFATSEERIAQRVVEALRQEREDGGDIGKQADRLFHSLVKYLDGTSEDRDRLMAQFGKTHLSRVFSLLRDLSSDDRETVLQLNQHRRK